MEPIIAPSSPARSPTTWGVGACHDMIYVQRHVRCPLLLRHDAGGVAHIDLDVDEGTLDGPRDDLVKGVAGLEEEEDVTSHVSYPVAPYRCSLGDRHLGNRHTLTSAWSSAGVLERYDATQY